MCRETLSQNTHACGAVAHGHVTTGSCLQWGQNRGGTARVLPAGCRSTGGTSPSQGNQHSQGGEGGRGLCRC